MVCTLLNLVLILLDVRLAQGGPYDWKTFWIAGNLGEWNLWSCFFQTCIMSCFHLVLIKHQLLEMNTFRAGVLSFLRRGVLTGFPSFRHVVVRTSPNHRYTFTLRTHPSVVPGSIAFSLPQVTHIRIHSLLFSKVVAESIQLKKAVLTL